jgi:hypothetical protein
VSSRAYSQSKNSEDCSNNFRIPHSQDVIGTTCPNRLRAIFVGVKDPSKQKPETFNFLAKPSEREAPGHFDELGIVTRILSYPQRSLPPDQR